MQLYDKGSSSDFFASCEFVGFKYLSIQAQITPNHRGKKEMLNIYACLFHLCVKRYTTVTFYIVNY